MIDTQQAIFMGRGTIRLPIPGDLAEAGALAERLGAALGGAARSRLMIGVRDPSAAGQDSAAPDAAEDGPSSVCGICVAELDDRVVGLAALLRDGRDTAGLILAVDRLCAAAAAVRLRLGEVALTAARGMGLLKVWMEVEPIGDAMVMVGGLFRRFGYLAHRSRFVDGRCRSEYVLDLYHRLDREREPAPPDAGG